MNYMTSLIAAGALALSAGVASAATITFGSFVTTDDGGAFPTPVVTVDDNTAGLISFSIASTGVVGNLAGAFFDVGGAILTLANILDPSRTILQFEAPTGNVGGGVTMNGGYTDGTNNPTFDFGLRIAQTDVSTVPFTFSVSSSLFSLADVTRIGLRFQSVGDDGEDSSKVLAFVSERPPEVVPLPAAGWLLLGGFAGLAALKRRRRTA